MRTMTFHIGRTIPKILKSGASSAIGIKFLHSKFIHTHMHPLYNANTKIASKLVVHNFKKTDNKDKGNFLQIIEIYKSNVKQHQGCVEFIKVALKHMEEFGVHKDLETYKNLLNVLPKGKYVPENPIQAMFSHYPLQQQLAVDLLTQMEHNGVIPDRETELILLNIYGEQGLPLKKYWRMMYWMPKFKYINPWRIADVDTTDPFEIAKFALRKMTDIDPATRITGFQTKDVPDAIEDTWVASAMSPVQEDLLAVLPLTESVYVEGPHKVWAANYSLDYFVLRGEPIKRNIIYVDPDDVSNIKIPYHEMKKVGIPLTVHEQDDGAYYALCITGTSTKDSVLSWIRCLEARNPILGKIPVVFKLKSSTEQRSVVDQSEKSMDVKKESQKDTESVDR